MPRSVPRVRVLALRSDEGYCQYVTENCQKYYDPHEFMACALIGPHQEQYILREVGINDWSKEDGRWNDITEAKFLQDYGYLRNFSPYMLYSLSNFLDAFDTLFERGACIW